MKDYDPAPSGRQLAVRLGPERIAFVLSVIVLIAAAILFGSRLGPPSARPASSTPSPAPAATTVLVPGGPARAQA